ncbi:MAG: DUF5947 family protein [Gemmatimonadales bacterium]
MPPEGPGSLVAELRKFARSRAPRPAPAPARSPEAGPEERCDFCSTTIPAAHRHMLDVEERSILCACEACLVRQAADPRYRPTGRRLVALDDFYMSDEIWSRFQVPVSLAFFLHSASAGKVIVLYPSPIGATESELDLGAWETLSEANPVLRGLEPDAEALLVWRAGAGPHHFIAPIDDCYRLVGLIKTRWQGISGGQEAEAAIEEFFAELRDRAVP